MNYWPKWVKILAIRLHLYGSRYSRMDQLKFVEDSHEKIWKDHTTSNFLKAVFHKFYLVHSWIPWPTYTHQIFGINDFKGHILKQPCHSGGFSAVVERIRLLEPILRTKYSKKHGLIQLSGFSRSGERNWGKFPFFKQ